MSRVKLAYIGAAAATVTIHMVAFGGLNAMKQPEPEKHYTAVMVAPPKPKAKPKEPPKPVEAPKEVLERPTQPRSAPKAAPVEAPPPDPVAAAHPALAAMPDFGINLSGGGIGGPGGIAVPTGGGQARPVAEAKPKEKVLGAVAERPAAGAGDCPEDLVKAKPSGFVKPAYTDDARAAGIEGRVRVEVTLDETGKAVSARVLSGLGHGLDESAVEAAKRMAFSPATKCGSAVKSTFVVSMRFVLGE